MEKREYTGWKAGLLVVLAIVVFVSVVNVLAGSLREKKPRDPGKVITTVTPSP